VLRVDQPRERHRRPDVVRFLIGAVEPARLGRRVDLSEPHGVMHELDEALSSFEEGAPLPVRARETLIAIDNALRGSGPIELGVSSARYIRTAEALNRAVSAVCGGTEAPATATRVAASALTMAHSLIEEQLVNRRSGSAAERMKKLLLEADVGPRPGGAGGLLTEPVVVFRSGHARGFTLLNQGGHRVGSAVAVGPASRARAPEQLEVRAPDNRCLFTVRDAGSWFSRLFRRWEYEILERDASQGLIVRRMAPRAKEASVARDDARVGVIRPGNPAFLSRAMSRKEFRDMWPMFVVETDTGEQVARIRLARPGWRTELLHVVVGVQDGASDELRRAALAAAGKAAFIAAVAQARRSHRRSSDGRGGYGLETAVGLASQMDIDF
jgi:hypothetical protein